MGSHSWAMPITMVTVSIMLPYAAFCLKEIKRRLNVGGGRAMDKSVGEYPLAIHQGAQGREEEDPAFWVLGRITSYGPPSADVACDTIVIQDFIVSESSSGSQAYFFHILIKWY